MAQKCGEAEWNRMRKETIGDKNTTTQRDKEKVKQGRCMAVAYGFHYSDDNRGDTLVQCLYYKQQIK